MTKNPAPAPAPAGFAIKIRQNPASAGFAIKIRQNPASAGFEKSKSGTTLVVTEVTWWHAGDDRSAEGLH